MAMSEKELCLFASNMAILSTFDTNRKRGGERKHPYRSPVLAAHKEDVEPLIKTTKEVVIM